MIGDESEGDDDNDEMMMVVLAMVNAIFFLL